VKESAWREATHPDEMLRFCGAKAGLRKLRLFAAACCRRLKRLRFPIEPEVQVLERYADGQASDEELDRVEACGDGAWEDSLDNNEGAVNYCVCTALQYAAYDGEAGLELFINSIAGAADWAALAFAWRATGYVLQPEYPGPQDPDEGPHYDHGCPQCRINFLTRRHDDAAERAYQAEHRFQCDLLRDLVSPSGPAPINPAWLTANDGAVVSLARAIYEERAFERLPVLADALEDAGCADDAVLGHCRGGEHVRGCWLLDALLGRG
jgi:hypothetical protein